MVGKEGGFAKKKCIWQRVAKGWSHNIEGFLHSATQSRFPILSFAYSMQVIVLGLHLQAITFDSALVV